MKILICNLLFVELSSDQNFQWIYERNIRVAPVTCIQTFLLLHMWISAPCLLMTGLFIPPLTCEFLVHFSVKSPSNISTKPIRCHILSFGTQAQLENTLPTNPYLPKNCSVERRGSQTFWDVESLYF